MEGTTSSGGTTDAETLATEGGGADQEVEGESCCVIWWLEEGEWGGWHVGRAAGRAFRRMGDALEQSKPTV